MKRMLLPATLIVIGLIVLLGQFLNLVFDRSPGKGDDQKGRVAGLLVQSRRLASWAS